MSSYDGSPLTWTPEDQKNYEIIQKLQSQLAKAKAALKFYSNGWLKEEITKSDGMRGHTWKPLFSLRNDHGETARQTLKELGE